MRYLLLIIGSYNLLHEVGRDFSWTLRPSVVIDKVSMGLVWCNCQGLFPVSSNLEIDWLLYQLLNKFIMVVSEESQKAVPPNNPPPPAGKTTDSAQDAQASEMPANLQEVLSHPLPSAKPTPLPALTPEQTTKYLALIEKVLTWTEVPTSSQPNSPTEPISRSERMWLTRECLLRYLRASKWSVPTAATRLLATLTWRHEYGLNGFTADYISPENETGKQVILGYDVEARPCLYLIPARQNTTYGPRQLHHLVYMLERTIDLMGPGQENVALLINYKEMSSGQQPPLSQGKQTMHILQNHYPERLGRSFIINRMFSFHSPPSPVHSTIPALTLHPASNKSPLVHARLFQADNALHRPRHPPQTEIQRGHESIRVQRTPPEAYGRRS